MPSEELQQVIALLRATSAQTPADETFAEGRERLDQSGVLFAVPDEVEVTPVRVAGVSCERFHPTTGSGDPTGGLVLYHHGGAYTAGSLDSHRSLTARMALASGCDLLSVDYRLAPEHPHPAGLQDARAVYHQVLADGTAPGRLVVGGDSAGAGLATALLLSLRDNDEPLPAGAVLLSPWLDLTLTSDSITSRAAEEPMLRVGSLARSAEAYAGGDLRRPLVSPVFADLSGLPPLLVLVGTAEILLDDSRTFADRARSAGVEVDLDVEQGLIHVWPFIDGVPEAATAMARIGTWARRHLAG
jgi:epsilon-lactone hydrolase